MSRPITSSIFLVCSILVALTLAVAAAPDFYGTVAAINGAQVVIRTKSGALLTVDASTALASERCVKLYVGENLMIDGVMVNGVVNATAIARAKPLAAWPSQ